MLGSLNEIEVMVRRCCRAVGMSWGLSYEAGRALRCLASCGIDVVAPLLPLLARADSCWDGGESSAWSSIAQGCRLSDGGQVCGKQIYERQVVLRDVLSPILLVGFLVRAFERWEGDVSVGWGEVLVAVTDGGFLVRGEGVGVVRGDVVDVVDVVVEVGGVECSSGNWYGVGDVVEGIEVGEGDWKLLEGYARRTYVRTSAGSRERGAG